MTNAISPAKVQRVSIVDDAEKVMEVIVEDKQLSLAIGKKGQNVRLAAKLTGWKIDIKSEEEKRREVEAQFGELEIGEAQPAPMGEAAGRRTSRPRRRRQAGAPDGRRATPTGGRADGRRRGRRTRRRKSRSGDRPDAAKTRINCNEIST